jgi:acetyl esterase/lipase
VERLLQTRYALAASVVLGLCLAFLINPVTAAVKARGQASTSERDAEQAQAVADAPAPTGRSARAVRGERKKAASARKASTANAPAARTTAKAAPRATSRPASSRSSAGHAATPTRTAAPASRVQAFRTAASRTASSRTAASRTASSRPAARRPATVARPKTTRTPTRTRARTPAPTRPRTTTPTPRRRVVAARVVSKDESYGSSRQQQVTVSRSTGSTGPRPTAYFIHGGGWRVGSRQEFAAESRRWAARGWTTVNVSYRLDVAGDLMLDDITTVVDRYQDADYVDPRRQVLVGNSAGGQLAAMIATRYPSRFKGVVAWSPVISPEAAYDRGRRAGARGSTVVLSRTAKRLWGSDWRGADPANFVTGSTPPLWTAASADEWLPWSQQGARMCSALGSRCTAAVVSGTKHGAHLMRARPDLLSRAFAWAEAKVD